jgi:hypothetical protein
MSTSELLAIAYAARHCTQLGCKKCASRDRWNRRKRWRSHKNPIRRSTGRK